MHASSSGGSLARASPSVAPTNPTCMTRDDCMIACLVQCRCTFSIVSCCMCGCQEVAHRSLAPVHVALLRWTTHPCPPGLCTVLQVESSNALCCDSDNVDRCCSEAIAQPNAPEDLPQVGGLRLQEFPQPLNGIECCRATCQCGCYVSPGSCVTFRLLCSLVSPTRSS